MFCSSCGSSIPADSMFCPTCGSRVDINESSPHVPISQVRPSYASNPVAERRSLRSAETDEIDKMIRHFSEKESLYEEYDLLCAKLDPRNRKKKVGLLVWGIIIAVVGLYVLLAGIALSQGYSSFGPIVFGLLIMAGGAVMIVFFAVTSKARNTNYTEACARFDQVSNELYQHYLDYGPCLVSAEYTNPSNLAVIRETILSGRADTIKEAVNVLTEDAHRYNMEAYARQSAISSANAARGAAAAAVFSAANLFLKR